MTREEALQKLYELTIATDEHLTIYSCECDCIIIPYFEGENLWLDRFMYCQSDAHSCECHELAAQYSLTPIEE